MNEETHSSFSASKGPLNNIVTEQIADNSVNVRLLKALENGMATHINFRNERYVIKSQKINEIISKVNLPSLDTQYLPNKAEIQINQASNSVREIASAQRDVEIALLRGMYQEEVYNQDLLTSSPLFDGDITTKPHKAQLMTQLEKKSNFR